MEERDIYSGCIVSIEPRLLISGINVRVFDFFVVFF